MPAVVLDPVREDVAERSIRTGPQPRRVHQSGRERYPEFAEEVDDVAGSAYGDGGNGDRVLQKEVSPDDPGPDLPKVCVAVGVGAPGNRHHRGEFRVAKGGKEADDARYDERYDEGGAGEVRRGNPVITKMPVPTTAPMPNRTSSNGFNTLFKACSPPVLSTSCRMDFVLKMRRGAVPDRSFIAGLFSRERLKGMVDGGDGRTDGGLHRPGLSSSQRRGGRLPGDV